MMLGTECLVNTDVEQMALTHLRTIFEVYLCVCVCVTLYELACYKHTSA